MSFMKNSGANSGEASRRGSVLMEFVVVAPLYFILLGGLFILGDLAMNRIRVHMGDHFVTWVGGSRFCPVKPSSKDDKDVDKVQALLKPLYDLSIGGAVDEVGFKVDTPSDQRSSRWNHTDLNHFMRLYMGRVKRLPLKMPDWARGMFGMQDAVTGTANMDEYETITYTSDECFRAYSFHRLLLTGIDTEDDGRSDTYSRARSISRWVRQPCHGRLLDKRS